MKRLQTIPKVQVPSPEENGWMDAGWMDLLLRPIRDHHLSPEWAERGWDGVGGEVSTRVGEGGGGISLLSSSMYSRSSGYIVEIDY